MTMDKYSGRPSLQRYNRPAQSFGELMDVPLADFAFLACWTVLGRAATEDEWTSAREIADDEHARLVWIEATLQANAAPGVRPMPEVTRRLRVYRLASTAWGRQLLWALDHLNKLMIWRGFARVGRRLAGTFRYTYRHTRKWLLRNLRSVRAKLRIPFRKAEFDDVTASLCPKERAILEQLLEASHNHSVRR